MGRKRVSGAARSDHRRRRKAKRPPGLRVVERDGFWHIHGTMRAAGRSERVRQSSGLPATVENWDAAESERLRLEGQFRDAVVHGKSPSVPLAVAADKYFQDRPNLAECDKKPIRYATQHHGFDMLDEISDETWQKLVAKRHAGNAQTTIERWLNPLVSFLHWCARKPRKWIKDIPEFKRDQKARKPKHRRARRVAELTPQLVLFMAKHASPHMKGQIAAQWATGARVSSVLHGCRLCDYIGAKGREQITFHDTKNGEPVVAALHPEAAALMAEYLQWRGNLHDREAPLFLTRSRQPYEPPRLQDTAERKATGGGQNKTAFKGMKRRTLAALRTNGVRRAREILNRGRKPETIAEAKAAIADTRQVRGLVRQVTQHWFRHALATKMMALGGDGALRLTMEQGGWLTAESVLGYIHDVPDLRRTLVQRMVMGESATIDRKEQA